MPPIEHHGLARRAIVEPSERHLAIRGAEILAVGEVVGVGGEHVDREIVSFRDLDLGQHRVGLQVHPYGDAHVLLA